MINKRAYLNFDKKSFWKRSRTVVPVQPHCCDKLLMWLVSNKFLIESISRCSLDFGLLGTAQSNDPGLWVCSGGLSHQQAISQTG